MLARASLRTAADRWSAGLGRETGPSFFFGLDECDLDVYVCLATLWEGDDATVHRRAVDQQ